MSNAVSIDERKVLKSLAIYGANNSGKTNIIALFEIIKKVLSGDDNFEINRQIFGDNPMSSFSITYNNRDGMGWMRYEFDYDSFLRKFVKEKLVKITYYQLGNPNEKIVFEKDQENKIYTLFGENESTTMSLVSSRLPLLYSLELDAGKFAPLKEYLLSLKALAGSIEIIKMFNIPIQHTIGALKSGDEKKRKFILDFVKNADLSVKDFQYEKNVKYEPKNVKGEINEEALAGFENVPDAFHLMTTYGANKVPSFFYDSSGTKKIEAATSYIYDAIADGKTLIVDEMDNGLHFRLTRAIVSAFNNLANTKDQLIFTTHNLLLVASKCLMRKEQICLLKRSHDGSTSVFCLKEATAANGGPREGSDILKRYNHGDFGDLPSPDFIIAILETQEKNE